MAQQSSCLSSHWRIVWGLSNNISIIIWCIIFRDFLVPIIYHDMRLMWYNLKISDSKKQSPDGTTKQLSLFTLQELFGTFKQYFHNYLMHYFSRFLSPNYLSWHEIDVIQPENKWQQETITRWHNKAVVSLHTEELFGTFKQYFHNYLMHYFSRFLSPNYLSWHEIDVIQPENKWQQETITRWHNKAVVSLHTEELIVWDF